MTKNLIAALGKVDIYLVAWLCDANGKIAVNGEIAFEVEDVPEY
jgi:hypothetical protein